MASMIFELDRQGPEAMPERLKRALQAFYARHRSLPAAIAVQTAEASAARQALDALDLKQLPIAPTGGCLVPEVWLGLELP